MKIGIFTECYHPTLNGVVVSIDAFKEELEKRGHEYYIFAPRTQGYQDKNPANVFRYPSFCWPGQKYYPIAITLGCSKLDLIRGLDLDIIHSQHLFSMGRLGMKVARHLELPLVYTYHTLIAEYTHYVPVFSQIAKRYLIKISREYCNACDQVVTPSPSMKKLLREYGVNTPIQAIPTGTNLADFKNPFHPELLRAKWHIPAGKKILLYVSRISKEKNLDFLFETIRILSKHRNDFHLLMVGGGPELAYYHKRIADWGIKAFVTFTNMQPKEETNRFFGAADIFVFPSITETQGIVITEAMAAGIPVVAVNKMGPSGIIQDGVDGFLIPLKTEEFCDRIERLLDNPKLKNKFGRQGQKNAEKFSTVACGLEMEKLYEKTLDRYRS